MSATTNGAVSSAQTNGHVDEEVIDLVTLLVAVKTLADIENKPWWRRWRHRHWKLVQIKVASRAAHKMEDRLKAQRRMG